MSGKCQGILEFQMKFRFSNKKKEEKYWKWLVQFSLLFGPCWTILTASKFFCLKENWRAWHPLSPQLPFVLRWWNVFVKHKIFPDYRNQSYCLIVNNNLGENMFCRSFSSGKFEFVSGKCQGTLFFPFCMNPVQSISGPLPKRGRQRRKRIMSKPPPLQAQQGLALLSSKL